jgi:hypothetical protein
MIQDLFQFGIVLSTETSIITATQVPDGVIYTHCLLPRNAICNL